MMVEKGSLRLQPVATDNASLRRLFRMLDIDFPAPARIPLFMLRASLKKGRLRAVYLTDGKRRYGYAIYQHYSPLRLIHVLYLAILPRCRSAGLGGVLLQRLNTLAHGRILLDAEDPAHAKTAEEREQDEKRIAFYLRNGYRVYPGFKFLNFGYHMHVLTNFAPPGIPWLRVYRALYNNAYGQPVACLLIQAYS